MPSDLILKDFIHVLELLVICLSQTTDFDQLCQIGIKWLLSFPISQEDFRLAGGVPLIILMCRRKECMLDDITKILEKFKNPTLDMIALACGAKLKHS